MKNHLGHRAVVVGGSIAGLITARVLSDHFDEIVILERDVVEDRPVLHRSVPQGHHLHAVLHGGQEVLEALYPGFGEQLRGLGANRVAVGRDIVWYLPDGKAYTATGSLRTPSDLGLYGHCGSRGLIEYLVRRRTTALANVRWEGPTAVRDLIHRGGRIRGVRGEDARTFEADLTVDATGRASRTPRWLEALGFAPPAETTIGLDTAYSTANFRVPDGFRGEPIIFITGPAPTHTRRGYVITIEGGTLLVSLIGRFGDYPPADRDGYVGFARALHSDLALRIIEGAEQVTPIAHHRFHASVQRHYERLTSFPEGLLVIGDALCTFNPIYAQGMSAAARQASLLGEVLSEATTTPDGLTGLARAFFARAAQLNSTPWNLAAGFDFAFSQTRGERPQDLPQRARYFAALDALQSDDCELQRLVAEVFHLMRPLSVLQEEPLCSRVLARMQAASTPERH